MFNRNAEAHFADAPSIDIPRSKFDRSFNHKTTIDAGKLYPLYCDLTIMPGDTVKMSMSELIRMTTPITPVMDNCQADFFWFFVPYRLIWDDFKQFMGENTEGPWTQLKDYEVPQIYSPTPSTLDVSPKGRDIGWGSGSLVDYLGWPLNFEDPDDWNSDTGYRYHTYYASHLPIRAYCLIWNEWFRSESLQTPCYITRSSTTTRGRNKDWKGDANTTFIGTLEESWYGQETYVEYAETGALPLSVCKYFDYFTACNPQPQKHDAISIPLGNDTINTIWTDGKINDGSPDPVNGLNHEAIFTAKNVRNSANDGSTKAGATLYKNDIGDQALFIDSAYYGLGLDLSQAVGATVTQIRQAFAIQRFYEREAMNGSRYIESVWAHYKVRNPDFRVQRPEFLGSKRIPINMSQVIQSSSTDATTPQGNAAGYSVTADTNENIFTHSFTEHGVLMGLMCIRTNNSYEQGLNAQYSKKKKFDFYFPEMANLSNMPVYKKELFLTGENQAWGTHDPIPSTTDDEAFGYQEAWASERYMPDLISGKFRSVCPDTLNIWHYGTFFNEVPTLSPDFIREGKENIQRTLAVEFEPQFLVDIYFKGIYTRPMPVYSVPGLIDHH